MKKKIFTRIIAIALVAVSIMAVANVTYATSITAYVNVPAGQTVNVRDWPDGNILFTLKRGTMVTIVAAADPTYDEVSISGKSGTYFIMRKFLSQTKPVDEWIERYGSSTLQYSPNSYSSYVKNLQKDLRSAGYTSISKADGYFGNITLNAVKKFQKNNGLTVDGKVGNQTKKALWNKLHP